MLAMKPKDVFHNGNICLFKEYLKNILLLTEEKQTFFFNILHFSYVGILKVIY